MPSVAVRNQLPFAEQTVLEAERRPFQLCQFGAEHQLVVEAGGFFVEEARLDDYETVAALLQLSVREPGVAEPLDASHFEVGEVGSVVDDALCVCLGVADPDFGFVDYYRPSNCGLRFSIKAPMPSRASSVAKRSEN